jgi:uncharacterized membrane protein YcaP (DUF421 family)
MGKRQIGQLDVSELVSTLLISEIASIPIDDPDIPLLNAIIPILFILSIEILLSTIKNKSEKLKSAIEGSPEYIIYKGRLLQKVLYDNRISMNELLSEMRTQGIGNIKEVEYATIEQNGALSILKKNDSPLAHAIIIDGRVIEKNVKRLGYNTIWLKKQLTTQKARQEDVLLMTADDSGEVYFIIKDGSF